MTVLRYHVNCSFRVLCNFMCNFLFETIRRYRSWGRMPKSQIRLIMLFAGSVSLTVLPKLDRFYGCELWDW